MQKVYCLLILCLVLNVVKGHPDENQPWLEKNASILNQIDIQGACGLYDQLCKESVDVVQVDDFLQKQSNYDKKNLMLYDARITSLLVFDGGPIKDPFVTDLVRYHQLISQVSILTVLFHHGLPFFIFRESLDSEKDEGNRKKPRRRNIEIPKEERRLSWIGDILDEFDEYKKTNTSAARLAYQRFQEKKELGQLAYYDCAFQEEEKWPEEKDIEKLCLAYDKNTRLHAPSGLGKSACRSPYTDMTVVT